MSTALSAVRRGQAWGSLYFPSNYSHSLQLRQREGQDASSATVDSSAVSVWLDMSSKYGDTPRLTESPDV